MTTLNFMNLASIENIFRKGAEHFKRLASSALPAESAALPETASLEEKAERYYALKQEFKASAQNIKDNIFNILDNVGPLDERQLKDLRQNLEKFYHPEAVKARAECGVHDNKSNHSFVTIAAFYGHLGALKEMVQSGVDVKKPNNQGWTAAVEAASRGHVHILNFLREQNVDLNADVAQAAVKENHLNVIKYLHAYGHNFNEAAPGGKSAISLAQKLGRKEILEFMNGIYTDNTFERGLATIQNGPG